MLGIFYGSQKLPNGVKNFGIRFHRQKNQRKPRLMGSKFKTWKGIDRFKVDRRKVPRLTEDDVAEISADPTAVMSSTPLGTPRPPVERVEVTSVEFIQNVKSLTYLAVSKLGCYNLTTAHVTKSSKAALERMIHYSEEIRMCSTNVEKNLHMYQIVVVEDVLGYSRDFESRHTLWIPDDFTLFELKEFLSKQCIKDPSLHAIHDLRQYFNPFVHPFQGDMLGRVYKSNDLRWRTQQPLELLQIRNKDFQKDLVSQKTHGVYGHFPEYTPTEEDKLVEPVYKEYGNLKPIGGTFEPKEKMME